MFNLNTHAAGSQSCLPFINEHQSILCRARVSQTVVDKNYCIWSWRLQAQFKIHRLAQEQPQGRMVVGVAVWIRLICCSNTKSKLLLILIKCYHFRATYVKILHLVWKQKQNEISPLPILNWTPYNPLLTIDDGKLELGVLTMKPILASAVWAPDLP